MDNSKSLALFYRSLIKSRQSLNERNRLAALYASASRQIHSAEWETILSHSDSFTTPLAKLRKFGFLQINLPHYPDIIRDLNSLSYSGHPKSGPGNRNETENLVGVEVLPSIQKLKADRSLYNFVSLYLNAPAYLHTVQAWWQYPMGPNHQPSNAQLWHRDRDDLSELKLFLYGTDVDSIAVPMHIFRSPIRMMVFNLYLIRSR